MASRLLDATVLGEEGSLVLQEEALSDGSHTYNVLILEDAKTRVTIPCSCLLKAGVVFAGIKSAEKEAMR